MIIAIAAYTVNFGVQNEGDSLVYDLHSALRGAMPNNFLQRIGKAAR